MENYTREAILKFKEENQQYRKRFSLDVGKKYEKDLSFPQSKSTVLETSPSSTGNKAYVFDKAWRELIQYGDPTLFDEIVHPEYFSTNHGVKINKEQSRRVLLTRKGKAVMGPYAVIYENEEFLCIHRYTRVNKYNFFSLISGVTYKLGLVYTQQTAREQLDNDPSHNFKWEWEDFEQGKN